MATGPARAAVGAVGSGRRRVGVGGRAVVAARLHRGGSAGGGAAIGLGTTRAGVAAAAVGAGGGGASGVAVATIRCPGVGAAAGGARGGGGAAAATPAVSAASAGVALAVRAVAEAVGAASPGAAVGPAPPVGAGARGPATSVGRGAAAASVGRGATAAPVGRGAAAAPVGPRAATAPTGLRASSIVGPVPVGGAAPTIGATGGAGPPVRAPGPGVVRAAVAAVDDVSVSAAPAGSHAGVVHVVVGRVVVVVAVHPGVVDVPVVLVPADPGPPEPVVELAVPHVVAVVGDPGAAVVVGSVVRRRPPVGVGPVEHTPLTVHVVDRVGVVVPVGRAVPVVEAGITDEVEDPVVLVDRVDLGIEVVGVDVEVVLLAPGPEVVGHRVGAPVFIQRDRAVGGCGSRRQQQTTQHGYGGEQGDWKGSVHHGRLPVAQAPDSRPHGGCGPGRNSRVSHLSTGARSRAFDKNPKKTHRFGRIARRVLPDGQASQIPRAVIPSPRRGRSPPCIRPADRLPAPARGVRHDPRRGQVAHCGDHRAAGGRSAPRPERAG